MTRQTRSSIRSIPASIEVATAADMNVAIKAGKAVKSASASKRGINGQAPPNLNASFQEVKPVPKRRKTTSKPADPTESIATSDQQIRASRTTNGQSAYTPTLLPPTLSFSLPEAIRHLTSHDPRFGHFFTHVPCKPFQPPLEAIDPYKTLVTSIIGQQVSWMAARAITKRFKELFGYTDEDDGFPSPMEVAKEDVMKLKSVGLSLRKAEYVICLAEHFVDGRLSTELLRDGTDEEISKALIAVRGIGQWTVDMFLMFSLRRPDVLPIGDLGVQKGLLRWALAAHGALPKSKGGKVAEEARKKYGLGGKDVVDKVDANGAGEIDTVVQDPLGREGTPTGQTKGLPPTPLTPGNMAGSTSHLAALHTPAGTFVPNLPATPLSPGPSRTTVTAEIKPQEVLETSSKDLPPPAPETFLNPMPSHSDWDAQRVAPLHEGLTVEMMKSRLSGKKAKGGAYLTAPEMDALTQGWKPYRSLGVYYMWPAGEEF